MARTSVTAPIQFICSHVVPYPTARFSGVQIIETGLAFDRVPDHVDRRNLRAHKVPGIQEAIEKARATLRYLPKYSPDLNPIEMSYSKFKALLRKVAARTVQGLYRTIRSFLPQLGAQECANYFRHAGYASN